MARGGPWPKAHHPDRPGYFRAPATIAHDCCHEAPVSLDHRATVAGTETMRLESTDDIRDFVMDERSKAVSEREWRHRLRGYGYAIRDDAEGAYVTSILRGGALCRLN